MPANSTESAQPTSARFSVDIRRFPWIRRLAADYAYNFEALSSFFVGDPSDRNAWVRAIGSAQQHPRQRERVTAILDAQLQRRGAPAQAREQARLIADTRTVAVVTGQQAGLFGGPLFTLLKALTALKLANQVSRDHGVPAVAIFWIDAEDHDWDEVRAATVFDEAVTPRSIALPARASGDQVPIAAAVLDDSIDRALAELEAALPTTDFRDATLAGLKDAYAPGLSMAEAFGRWLEAVLGPRGLVVYDSSDREAKPLAAELFARELSAPGTTGRLAAEAGAALVARGYHAQVTTSDDSPALFYFNGSRRSIKRDGDVFMLGDTRVAADALAQVARERPWQFSPNVLLRPLFQDTLFPTVCYVAGPNELAYLGQLRKVYEHFGLPMPLVFQRLSATILDSAGMRFLQKYTPPFEALQAQDDAALNDLLRSQIPAVLEQAFAAAATAIDAHLKHVVAALPALDPTLEGAGRSTLSRMQHDLETLHNKAIQAAKRRDETLRRQFGRTRAMAFPQGHAQERSIGFVSFLNQYGPPLVQRLDDELTLEPGCHWVVTI